MDINTAARLCGLPHKVGTQEIINTIENPEESHLFGEEIRVHQSTYSDGMQWFEVTGPDGSISLTAAAWSAIVRMMEHAQ